MNNNKASNPSKELPRFRHMTWLEPNPTTRAATKPLLSPTAHSANDKHKVKGVKPFRTEKHSRFSSVGTHLMTKDQRPISSCGLSHDEENNARFQPNRRAISYNKPGSHRFKGYDSHYKISETQNAVNCGLSHDEAQAGKVTKISTQRSEANLGGMEPRFQGVKTHFVQEQGKGSFLPQDDILTHTRGNATMPKSDWLRNLWISSGTALEDREMLGCEAVMAPVFPLHEDFKVNGGMVMDKDKAERFTFQKTKQTFLEYSVPADGFNKPLAAPGKGSMHRKDKHSRFSMVGGMHHQ